MKKILLSFVMLMVGIATSFADEVVFDFTNPLALTPSITPSAEVSTGVDLDGTPFTNGGVSLAIVSGTAENDTHARIWTTTKQTTELRAYKNSTMTLTAPEAITSIAFVGKKNSAMTAAEGTFEKGSWTGSSKTVTFSITGTLNVEKVTVVYGKGGEVTPDPEPQPEGDAYFAESFLEGQGAFTIDDKVLPDGSTYVWKHSERDGNKFMQASAFVKGAKASESWLVSPVVDLTQAKTVVLSYNQVTNFFKGNFTKDCSVKVKAEGTEWVDLALTEASDSWDFVPVSIDMKAFAGKKVQIAFVYTSNTEIAGTWRIKDLKVAASAGVDPTPDPEPQPEPQPEENGIFFESFSAGQGAFTIEDKLMPEGSEFIWKHDDYNGKTYMKASAYFGGAGHDAESWLVSPVIDLVGATDCVLSFDQAANFFKGFEGRAVMVKIEDGEWEKMTITDDVTTDSWDFVSSTVDLKKFDGKKVQLAFVYTSVAATSGTWEVNNVKIDGKVASGIEGVESENGAQVIYDLSGRRVAKAVKGLYIINGKKVYVK